jgi:hypothetical protein
MLDPLDLGALAIAFLRVEEDALAALILDLSVMVVAIHEIERRAADADLVHWLRRDGEGTPPRSTRWYDGHPKPSGYLQYFTRLYRD